jgi:UPF0755 protein
MKASAVARKRAGIGKRPIVFIAVIAFLVIACLFAVLGATRPVAAFGEASKIVQVEIPIGSSTSRIAGILAENGLIRSPMAFRIISRLKGYDGKYMAGTYMIETGMDIDEIMDKMLQGKIYKETVRFTVPEGYEIRQIADMLDEKGIVSKEDFLDAINNEDFDFEFLKGLERQQNRLEGYLFPDTYEVFVGETAKSIVQRMLERFEEVAVDIGLLDWKSEEMSVDQLVTLASIVEREAANDDERPLVSAVFHNRLKIGERLRSCATVQYVLQERKPRLSNEDIQVDSPYNTYIIDGLPPGPIASPGASSLKAAMQPADVDYLWFVLQKDGSHSFSNNYNQFLRDKARSKM